MEIDKVTSKAKNYSPLDKPLVSILLAVYKPNKTWLVEQLVSLNEQTYDNIELIVYDDCPEYPVEEKCFKKYITNFKYTLVRGKKNQGSNKAFEELTKVGNGEFFAYCDQDDIWETNKIEILLDVIKKEKSLIVYSDMFVIDENGDIKAKSLRDVRSRLNYVYGEKLISYFFFKNCIAGCSMMVDSRIAKMSIPFSKVTVHDQWIAIVGSFYGKISFVDKCLVKYRIHKNNQTGILSGVYNKEDYYKNRVIILRERAKEIKSIIDNLEFLDIETFCDARINKKVCKIFKYKYLSEKEAYFEIVIKYMPNWLFKIIIKKLK